MFSQRSAGLLSFAIAFAILALPAVAAPPDGCKFGQRVTDPNNNYGLIVSERDGLCLVRSLNGTALNWVAPAQLTVASGPPPAATAQPSARVTSTAPAANAAPAAPPPAGVNP